MLLRRGFLVDFAKNASRCECGLRIIEGGSVSETRTVGAGGTGPDRGMPRVPLVDLEHNDAGVGGPLPGSGMRSTSCASSRCPAEFVIGPGDEPPRHPQDCMLDPLRMAVGRPHGLGPGAAHAVPYFQNETVGRADKWRAIM